MPWDKALKITYPGLSGQYVDAYKYTLQTKLDFGFEKLVDLVKSPADQWNRGVNAIFSEYQQIIDTFEDNLSTEFEAITGFEEIGSLPNNMTLEQSIEQLPKQLEKIQDSIDQIAKITQDNSYQKATKHTVSHSQLNQLHANLD